MYIALLCTMLLSLSLPSWFLSFPTPHFSPLHPSPPPHPTFPTPSFPPHLSHPIFPSHPTSPSHLSPHPTSSPHRHIETSLGALATQINFFIHNLAQFKFQASANAPALLSFCPQSYSIATDGKITSAIITSFHKRFYPETYYVSRYRWLGRGGR